ncbi:hypothetical protein WMF38_57085 [Sorangium sp. So ce118]
MEARRRGAPEPYSRRDLGMTRHHYITTITGGIWYPFDPRPEFVRLADARALAYQARFLGHAGATYSPIQHMVLVARWLIAQGADGATVREGLGHDIHEAWPPGDVPAPCKRGDAPEAAMMRAWEKRVECAVKPVFGLPVEMSPAVKTADAVLFATEVRDLNPAWPGDVDWGPLKDPWRERIEAWLPERAWNEWIGMWIAAEKEAR